MHRIRDSKLEDRNRRNYGTAPLTVSVDIPEKVVCAALVRGECPNCPYNDIRQCPEYTELHHMTLRTHEERDLEE